MGSSQKTKTLGASADALCPLSPKKRKTKNEIKNKIQIIAASTALVSAANANIIVDVPVEINGIWSNTDSLGWHRDGGVVPGTGFDGRPFYSGNIATQEGRTATHNGGRTVVSTPDLSLGNHTLQEGTYSLLFAMGNYNNQNFNDISAFNFSGISSPDNAIRPSPARGEWEIWILDYEVAANNPNIGSPLNFSMTFASTGNASFDGVGGLSNLGNGFLVDFTAPSTSPPTNSPVPEPSSTIALAGLLGLGLLGRRRKS